MDLKLLKDARVNRGITQDEIAKMMGYCGKSWYSMFERGLIKPTIEHSMKIKNILNLSDSEYQEIFIG